MSSELIRATLFKVVGPMVGIGVLLWAAHRGRLSRSQDLGLTRPPPARTALWLGVWAACIVLTEALRGALGMPDPPAWEPYPALIFALRIVAIGVLGPILEELLFRGVSYGRLARSRLGPAGAIAVIAAGWALIHTGQGWPEIGFTFLDGLVLGAARWHTGSIVAPCAMHVTGNLFSIGQSLRLL